MDQVNQVTDYANKKCETLRRIEMFTMLNSTRTANHAANGIRENEEGKIFATRCNCGKKVYHPILCDGVIWGQVIPPKKLQILKKKNFNEIANYISKLICFS